MKTRQKILLAILEHFTDPPTKTQLVKLLFLLGQETKTPKQISFYDFLPYRFGPFSFTVYKDLEDLERSGLVYPNSLQVMHGQKQTVRNLVSTLPQAVLDNVASISQQYSTLPPNRLVRQVYATYPWYASRSEKRPRAVRQRSDPALYTIGYEGKSIDAFLNELLLQGIERIIDVRNNPLSRKYGFSKSMLRNLTGKVEIEYAHIPALGIPSADRKRLVAQSDYDSLFAIYTNTILPKQKDAVQQTASLLADKPSVLMCFEHDANFCHRGKLAKYLASIIDLPMIHL